MNTTRWINTIIDWQIPMPMAPTFKIVWFASLAMLPASALGQAAPYKLILVANNSTVALEYPNLARCQLGKAAAETEARKRDEVQAKLNPGLRMDAPLRVIAFCIPG